MKLFVTIFTGFKNLEEEDKENCPIGEELCERMNIFNDKLMQHVSLKALLAPPEEEVQFYEFMYFNSKFSLCRILRI